jgi:hypothetical protein
MKLVNNQVLASLANADLRDAAVAYGANMPTDIRDEFIRQTNERNNDIKKAAVTEIISLLDNKDEFIVANQIQIMELEKQVAAMKALQAKTQRAAAYGTATRNFLPLVKIIGGVIPTGTEKSLTVVADDWTDPVVAAPAATA